MPNLRRFLPIAKYHMKTSLPSAEAIRRLTDAIETPGHSIGFSKRTIPAGKRFTGTISGYKFSIKRSIEYRNSFQPTIRGQIIPFPGGTGIEASMRPNLFSIVFMSFWLGTVGLISLAVIVYAITHIGLLFKEGLHTDSIVSLIPLGLFALGYGLLMFGFWTEAGKARDSLAEILEAEPM